MNKKTEKTNKKVVLITGSSIGIGNECIKVFAKHGYNVIINYLTHEEEAKSLKDVVEKEYNIEALTIKADIRNENDINNMLATIIKRFNRLDVLINNASLSIDTPFNEITKSTYSNILETNVFGTFLVSKIIGTYMYNNKNGVILNVSSNNSINDYSVDSIEYDSSKAAINNLTHNLAVKYSPYVRVNCICPGWTGTNNVLSMNPNTISSEKERILLKRFAAPHEIANVMYFLCSEDASYVNNQVIVVDGGTR